MSLEGFKKYQYFNPSISCKYWHSGEGCWDLEGRYHILFSPNVWVEIDSSATALLLWSKTAQTPDSSGAAGREAGLMLSVCTTVLRCIETLSFLHTWQRSACHRHEPGPGVRCDEWALFIFPCQWDLEGVLNYSPTRSGMNCSDQPTFSIGTCMCLHFFFLELVLWHIPQREKSYSMLCQWAQQPQAMLGSLHGSPWAYPHSPLSMISMCLKATEW